MQIHAYEEGDGDVQSGHVAPGGQAEWWRRRARSLCPCLGKECPDSGLDCLDTSRTLCRCASNTPMKVKTNVSSHICIYSVRCGVGKATDRCRQVVIGWDRQCVSHATGVCVTKAGTPQGFAMQRDTRVRSPARSWRTQNMLTKIKHQVCIYAM